MLPAPPLWTAKRLVCGEGQLGDMGQWTVRIERILVLTRDATLLYIPQSI